MADKMQEHTQDSEEMAPMASDLSENVDMLNANTDKDKSYAKRMQARRRIELMKDEKELEKKLTRLDWDWPEESSFQSQ